MHQLARRSPRLTPRIDEELLFHEVKKVNRGEIKPGVPPEAKRPVLACYECSGFTVHEFLGRRPVTDSTGTIVYVELIYKCLCDKERVFGTESQ